MKALRPLLALLIATSPVLAQTAQTWSFSGTGGTWSTTTNWNPNGSPAGNDVVFGDTGVTSGSTTIGSVVDTSYTLNSLKVNVSLTTWQVMQIGAGNSLTLNSVSGTLPNPIFSVGQTNPATKMAILGSGTFVINQSNSSMSVGGATASNTTTLDMSNLAAFRATLGSVNIGSNRGNGVVNLAVSNVVTATTVNIGTSGASTGNGTASVLNLGTTNAINADAINVGQNLASGFLAFHSGLSNAQVTIRGSSSGTSRADLIVAFTNGAAVGNGQNSTVDFTGGTVDARLNNLVVGKRDGIGGQPTYSGTLKMNSGIIDANTVTIGQTLGTGTATNSATGVVSISGGTFNAGVLNLGSNSAGATSANATLNVSGSASVTIAGNLVAGSKAGTATAVNSTVNISAGTLVVQGNFAEGTGAAGVTSTVNLSGGKLELSHGNISVDTFTMTGGTLKNIGSFQANTTGGLNLQNAATLAYDVDNSFTSLALTGTLSLSASSNLSLTLANGVTPVTSYTLVDNDGSDLITGTFGTINGSAFGVGNTFSLTNDIGTYQFQLSYTGGTGNDLVATVVPEPKAMALAGLGLMTVLFLRRRQARAKLA